LPIGLGGLLYLMQADTVHGKAIDKQGDIIQISAIQIAPVLMHLPQLGDILQLWIAVLNEEAIFITVAVQNGVPQGAVFHVDIPCHSHAVVIPIH